MRRFSQFGRGGLFAGLPAGSSRVCQLSGSFSARSSSGLPAGSSLQLISLISKGGPDVRNWIHPFLRAHPSALTSPASFSFNLFASFRISFRSNLFRSTPQENPSGGSAFAGSSGISRSGVACLLGLDGLARLVGLEKMVNKRFFANFACSFPPKEIQPLAEQVFFSPFPVSEKNLTRAVGSRGPVAAQIGPRALPAKSILRVFPLSVSGNRGNTLSLSCEEPIFFAWGCDSASARALGSRGRAAPQICTCALCEFGNIYSSVGNKYSYEPLYLFLCLVKIIRPFARPNFSLPDTVFFPSPFSRVSFCE